LPIASPPTGYLFSMWDQSLPDTMPAEPLSITASFMPMVFTITWEGSDLSPTQLAYGSPIELPSITKEGYDFEAWYLDSSFETLVDLTTMPAQDLTFYASWLVHYHELYYYIFENRYDMGSIAYGTHPNIPTHVFPDKDFLGYTWNGEFIDGQNFLMPDEEVTLYAVYLDDVAPIVSGVENREHYPSGTSLIITFDEGTATLNGEEFLSGTEVSESGIYTLIVTDAALNQTEVTFVIETTVLPTILISAATTVALGAIWIFRKQIFRVLIRK
ncbi:MAG: InlB B-repeat-containing protein, partial [Candidatus Izemoplasmatales bacterium]